MRGRGYWVVALQWHASGFALAIAVCAAARGAAYVTLAFALLAVFNGVVAHSNRPPAA